MALLIQFVGIDVAKEWLDVWFQSIKQFERFTNDPAGQSHRVRLYARGIGCTAKNDRIDARVIARFAAAVEFRPEVLDPIQERLAELVAHRRRLIDDRTALSNQLGTVRGTDLREQIRQRIAQIERHIAKTDTLLHEAIGTVPALFERVRLMKTLAGVRDITANALAALLPELGNLNRRAIAALAGLAPFDHDSGTMKGKRCISGGRAAVRTALYMAARAAALSKSPLGDFYKRLIAAGKLPKVATVALMRKMLTTLNAMLRDGTPWKHTSARKRASATA